MQAGNGTAPATGAPGAGGGRPTLDQIIFMGLQSNPGKMTSWTALGAALSGLATGKIILDTGRYYEFFHDRDTKWVQMGVAAGSMAACAQFAICVAQAEDLAHRLGAGADQQAWKLSRHAFTDFHNVSRFDSMAGNSSDLIGAFTNLAASTYYTYRAYKMSGRKWWLGSFIMLFACATFVMGLLVAIKGMTAPRITLETAMRMRAFNDTMIPLRKTWGALSMASDGMVVVIMMFYLIKSRDSVFHREKRIYHKLIVLIFETMLPPALCILVLDITASSKASPTADYRKPLRMLIPTLFYVSLIHSLVARATIRQMLGTSLASNGMLKPDHSTQAGESMFVATYGQGGEDSKAGSTRDLESGDVKDRDLGGNEQVFPLESYRRDGSPISHSSANINKSKTAL